MFYAKNVYYIRFNGLFEIKKRGSEYKKIYACRVMEGCVMNTFIFLLLFKLKSLTLEPKENYYKLVKCIFNQKKKTGTYKNGEIIRVL